MKLYLQITPLLVFAVWLYILYARLADTYRIAKRFDVPMRHLLLYKPSEKDAHHGDKAACIAAIKKNKRLYRRTFLLWLATLTLFMVGAVIVGKSTH